VLVVEVDVVHAQPLERGVARLLDVLGPAADAEPRAARVADDAELRGEHHVVAAALDGAAHELLVAPDAVHVRGVEEVDPELQRAVDRGDRLRLVRVAVELRHPHAAQPHGGYLEALRAKCPSVHSYLPGTSSPVF
jgi:hypothetical protein